jgi:branched-chain amino acid transport system substrate-binding protein
MKSFKKAIFYIIILCLIFCNFGCYKSKDIPNLRTKMAKKKNAPIKIGVAWSFGSDNLDKGVKLAIDEINENGGILKKKLSVVMRDESWDISQGLAVAEEFCDDPSIFAVIGHSTSAICLNVALTYEISNLLMFTPGASNPDLTKKGYKFINRNIPSDEQIGDNLGDICIKNNYQNIVVCYANDAYGRGLANAFERKIENNDIKVMSSGFYSTGVRKEFEYTINTWKMFNFDAVFFAGSYEPGVIFIKALRKNGYLQPVLSGDGIDSPDLIKMDDKDIKNVFIASLYNPYSTKANVIKFREMFFKKYGIDADLWAAMGYDSVYVIAEAMKRANSCDPKLVSPEIRKIKNLNGVTGNQTFDENGNVVDKKIILKFIENKEFKYIEE